MYGWEMLEGIRILGDIRLMIQMTLSSGNSGNFNIGNNDEFINISKLSRIEFNKFNALH